MTLPRVPTGAINSFQSIMKTSGTRLRNSPYGQYKSSANVETWDETIQGDANHPTEII